MLNMFNEIIVFLLYPLWKSLPYIRSSMWPLRSPDTAHQRLQSDLQRTRLSRHRLIWFLPPPPPLSPVSKLSLFLSLSVCRRWSLLTNRGEGVGEEPYHTTARKPGPSKHSILFAEHRSGFWLTFSSFTTIVALFVSFAVPASYSMY